ncbi:MAG: MerR family transcriptional regulator [Bacteroidia bacterium]|nr:MerR family transcriptional regulator [Bacteroidia bacterium]
MSKEYDIALLEKLTNIKAHTIRIWEQRYNLLNPHRTPTNIRVYNDYHLQKILNVKLLIDYGYKISEVADMDDEQIKSTTLNILKTTQQTSNIVLEYFQNELILATENLNEIHFERTYLNAINKYGIYKTVKDIVYPFLNRIGILWSIGNISPLQEHFASQIIIRKIQSAIDALDISVSSKTSYLLFLLPNEYHQIPLLFSNYILRSHKKHTYYLGEDVPVQNVVRVCKEKSVHYLVSFVTAGIDKDFVEKVNYLVKNIPEHSKLIMGGSKMHLDELSCFINSKKIIYNRSIEDFLKLI